MTLTNTLKGEWSLSKGNVFQKRKEKKRKNNQESRGFSQLCRKVYHSAWKCRAYYWADCKMTATRLSATLFWGQVVWICAWVLYLTFRGMCSCMKWLFTVWLTNTLKAEWSLSKENVFQKRKEKEKKKGNQESCGFWIKPSCKAQWKGGEDKADKGRGGKTTSGNGQACSSPSPRGQWRTGKNGGNWLRNHLGCPNDPRCSGIDEMRWVLVLL